MDRTNHQVGLANWAKIIEQCNNRPAGTTASKRQIIRLQSNWIYIRY